MAEAFFPAGTHGWRGHLSRCHCLNVSTLEACVSKVVFASSVSTLGLAFSEHHLAPLYIPIDEGYRSTLE